MNIQEKAVTTIAELVAACEDNGIHHIAIHGDLTGAPSCRLSPGQTLRGADERASVSFADETDGIHLSSNNRIHNIRLHASPSCPGNAFTPSED
jgi:hypothetical protein